MGEPDPTKTETPSATRGGIQDEAKGGVITDTSATGAVEQDFGQGSSVSSKHEDLPTDGSELVPQPSASPDDPLNWTWLKKHTVMLALIPGCMLSDWTLTWGTTVFEQQAPEWYVNPVGLPRFVLLNQHGMLIFRRGMSIEAVAQSVSPGIFMQGPGGLIAVPLCQRYGR